MTNISQVFISDDEKPIPNLLQESINSVKKNLVHSNHHIYFKNELEDLISGFFPKGVLMHFAN